MYVTWLSYLAWHIAQLRRMLSFWNRTRLAAWLHRHVEGLGNTDVLLLLRMAREPYGKSRWRAVRTVNRKWFGLSMALEALLAPGRLIRMPELLEAKRWNGFPWCC